MRQFWRAARLAALLCILLVTGCAGQPATRGVPDTGVIQPGTVLNVPESIALPAQRQAVALTAGQPSAVVVQTLQPGVPAAWQIQAGAGQHLFIAVNGNAKYQVYGPDGEKLSAVLAVPGPVDVLLDRAGTYSVAVSGEGEATISLSLLPAGAASPLPANLKMVDLPESAAKAGVSFSMASGQPQGFTFTGLNGQTVAVKTGGHATVMLVTPDNVPVVPADAAPGQWSYDLPEGGRYTLALFGSGLVQVRLQSSPVPGGVPTAIPRPATAERVAFSGSDLTATVNVALTPGAPRAYVVSARQGQMVTVLAGGQTVVSIYGPGGGSLTLDHPSYTNGWSTQAYQTGDYTVVVAGSGPTTLTFNVQ